MAINRELAYRFNPGVLNPHANRSNRPFTRSDVITDDSLSIYRETLSSNMTPNIFEGALKFNAVCLLAYPVNAEDSSVLSWLSSLTSGMVGEVYEYICMIPIMHAHLPNPFMLTNPEDQLEAVLKYPVFYTRMQDYKVSGEETVTPGSIVEIEFNDTSYEIGYFNRLISKNMDPAAPTGWAPSTARSAFDEKPLEAITVPSPVELGVDNLEKLRALANQVGIELSLLMAVRKVESGGQTNAIRFEPHWFVGFNKTVLTTEEVGVFELDSNTIPYSPGSNPPVDPNYVNTHEDAFQHASTIDIISAIKSTSWGLYQVMGVNASLSEDTTVKNALGSVSGAEAFVKYFYENPLAVSDEMLIAWFKHPNNLPARQAAQQDPPDFLTFARTYNGPKCCGPGSMNYDKKIEQAYYAYKQAGYDETSPDLSFGDETFAYSPMATTNEYSSG